MMTPRPCRPVVSRYGRACWRVHTHRANRGDESDGRSRRAEAVVRIALLALHFAEYASRLAVALAAKHEVLLLLRASNADNELTADLRGLVERSVDVRYLEVRRHRDPRVLGTSIAINRAIRPFSPAVLHVQEPNPLLAGWTIMSLRKNLPVVMTVHDPVSHSGGPPTDSLFWKTLMWFRRRASRLIVHGPRMQAELEGLDGHLAHRVDVIPHGVLGQVGGRSGLSRQRVGDVLVLRPRRIVQGPALSARRERHPPKPRTRVEADHRRNGTRPRNAPFATRGLGLRGTDRPLRGAEGCREPVPSIDGSRPAVHGCNPERRGSNRSGQFPPGRLRRPWATCRTS